MDFWAFNLSDAHDFLLMIHTRTNSLKVAIAKGDKFDSSQRIVVLTLSEDTTKGVDDIIWSACDEERYHMQ